jgi:hypothetical protein
MRETGIACRVIREDKFRTASGRFRLSSTLCFTIQTDLHGKGTLTKNLIGCTWVPLGLEAMSWRRRYLTKWTSGMMFRRRKFENQRWCIGREQAAAWRAATGGAATCLCRVLAVKRQIKNSVTYS